MSEQPSCPLCLAPLAGSPQTDFGGQKVHTACLRDGMNEMYDTKPSTDERKEK